MNLKTNLIAHWKLDETSGTRNDSHGSNNLTENGTVSASAGMLGNAADFDTINNESLSIASASSNLVMGDIDFSIACWCKFTTLPSGSGGRTLVSKFTLGGNLREYAVLVEWSGSANVFEFIISPEGTSIKVVSAASFGTISTNTWYFVVAWHDSVNNTVNIQINNGVVFTAFWGAGVASLSAPFYIGALPLDTYSQDGLVDSVSVWKRTLTSAERKALYNSGDGLGYSDFDAWDGTLNQDLISHWKLNEASGTRIDSHGSNDLTDNNTVGSAAGKLGNAAAFVSANAESLSVVDNSSLSIGSSSFTLSFWVKFTSIFNFMPIIAKTVDGSGNNDEFNIDYISGQGIRAYVGNGTTFAEVFSPGIALDTWYHIIVWYDTDTQNINIQRDNGTVSSNSISGPLLDTAATLYFGKYSHIGGSFFLDGYLDSVSFWKRVLTSAERKALYNSSNALDYENFSQWVGSLKHNLISHWQLDETGGTRADTHGSNDLTDNNTVGSATGKLGNAGDFVYANSEYLSIVDNAELDTGDIDFTLSCWVKMDDKSHHHPIIQKSWDESYGEYILYYNVGGDFFRFDVANGAIGLSASSLGSPSAGVWYFIVAWYDSVANTVNIQVNNGTVDSASLSGGNTTTNGTVKIGRAFGEFFSGLIDSVSYWKRALTSAERRALYNSGNGLDYSGFNLWQGTLKQDLISHWKLEEASGTRFDAHGNNDLTDNNTVTNATGKIGNAANFVSANNEYLDISSAPIELQTRTEFDWTTTFWFKANSGSTVYRIMQWNYPCIIRQTSDSPTTIQVVWGSFCTGPQLPNGVWNFCAIKWNAASSTLSIRVNNGTASTFAVTGEGDSSAQFSLSSSASDPIDGLLDSVSFWERQLTSAEETTLYNAGAGLDYDSFVSSVGNSSVGNYIVLKSLNRGVFGNGMVVYIPKVRLL